MTSADDAGIDPRLLLGDFSSSLWIPRYRAGTWGPWSLSVILMTGARGYWGKTYGMAGTTILTGPSEGSDASWMSIVPAEVESQEIGIAAAYGHTAVLGMGMGWCAANVALNPAVERVTVVERDPHIIELIDTLGIFEQLPPEARAKITVVEDDALAWRPDGRVDSVQADIWAKFVEPQKWDDVHRIQANTGAESLYFWGQEMELYRLACRELGHEPERLDRETIIRLAESTGLPLVHPDWPDYADRIVAAAPWWTPRDGNWWRAE
ncbi:MAG: hypothetical protein V4610_16900 [Pseudomonadota bacterium]|jgi:type III secretion system FlhB-like substrate exporter|uniref:Spermidine synthase n=1 Tax=hydrothermal vent metagenome TaxID=652676 RepID=A0A160TFR4_9ZZZZ